MGEPNAAAHNACGAAPEIAGTLTQRYTELRRGRPMRKYLRARSAMLFALRKELHSSGHIEVDTPLLQTGTSESHRSFRTVTQSLEANTYLRQSPLHLRAMLTADFGRVFEIGRTFRDEPVDLTHSPEYSLVELYQAGADYHSLRTVAQTLVNLAAVAVSGETVAPSRAGGSIDLATPWAVVKVYDAVGEAIGHAVHPGMTAAEIRRFARLNAPDISVEATADELILWLYDELVEPATVRPTFYVDFPSSQSPLAESCGHDSRLAQKWDLVIDGREVGTAYTEVVDAGVLERRLGTLAVGGPPAEGTTIDSEWLDVFAAGMPPSGGLCLGVERLLLTVTGASSVHQVIPFPLPIGS